VRGSAKTWLFFEELSQTLLSRCTTWRGWCFWIFLCYRWC